MSEALSIKGQILALYVKMTQIAAAARGAVEDNPFDVIMVGSLAANTARESTMAATYTAVGVTTFMKANPLTMFPVREAYQSGSSKITQSSSSSSANANAEIVTKETCRVVMLNDSKINALVMEILVSVPVSKNCNLFDVCDRLVTFNEYQMKNLQRATQLVLDYYMWNVWNILDCLSKMSQIIEDKKEQKQLQEEKESFALIKSQMLNTDYKFWSLVETLKQRELFSWFTMSHIPTDAIIPELKLIILGYLNDVALTREEILRQILSRHKL